MAETLTKEDIKKMSTTQPREKRTKMKAESTIWRECSGFVMYTKIRQMMTRSE